MMSEGTIGDDAFKLLGEADRIAGAAGEDGACGQAGRDRLAGDAGDGNEQDFVIWKRPRFVAPNRPELLLRDLRGVTRELTARRDEALRQTARYLRAAADVAEVRRGRRTPAR